MQTLKLLLSTIIIFSMLNAEENNTNTGLKNKFAASWQDFKNNKNVKTATGFVSQKSSDTKDWVKNNPRKSLALAAFAAWCGVGYYGLTYKDMWARDSKLWRRLLASPFAPLYFIMKNISDPDNYNFKYDSQYYGLIKDKLLYYNANYANKLGNFVDKICGIERSVLPGCNMQ